MCGPKFFWEGVISSGDGFTFTKFGAYHGGSGLTKKGFSFCFEFREILGGIRYLSFLMRKKNDSEMKMCCMWGRHEKKILNFYFLTCKTRRAQLWGAVAAPLISRKITPMLIIHTSANWTHVIKAAAAATFEGCGKNRNKPLNCGMTRKPFLSSWYGSRV